MTHTEATRRAVLGTALGAAAAAALPTSFATAASASASLAVDSWQLRWAPEASVDGLPAFESIEDDRADSHPAGQPHIYPEGNNYRRNTHMVDRDTSTDRPMDISVDGQAVARTESFAPTGSWDSWTDVTVSVPLAAGSHIVRATATTADGAPNLDYLEVREP